MRDLFDRLVHYGRFFFSSCGVTIGALLQPATPFDPETEELHTVILTADYVSLLLAPILAEICAREAPRVVFEFGFGCYPAPHRRSGGDRFSDRVARLRVGALPLWRDEVVCLATARNSAICRASARKHSVGCAKSPFR